MLRGAWGRRCVRERSRVSCARAAATMGRDTTLPRLLLGCILSSVFVESFGQYYGKEIGALSELHHGVRGRVYAIDSRTLFIRDFHYDGEGPTAYFYVGASKTVTAAGAWRLRDERGGATPLRRYRGEGVTLSLPEHKTFRDIRWFAVWCDEFAVNFGDVAIPAGLEYPRPVKAGALRGVHGVSSDPLVVVDAQTLLLPNFSYDGEAPDAKFWVGRGDKPSPQGIRIPDENGKEAPLRKYDRKTIVLTLPGELTVFDIGHFAVWCEAFTVNFGHVPLPRAQLKNIPPSLKMLGVSPQSKLNCEVLHDELAFEVRWAVAGDSIVLQLVAKLEDDEYMSFGLSGDARHSQMVGGDVAVAWLDKTTLKGYAVDYYLDAKSQCAGVRGSCPDERLGGEKTNSIKLLNAALVNGYSIVTYQRSLKAGDDLDLPVLTNVSQPVIWALGPLNSRDEVSYHHHFTKGDKFIEFGRPPVWNCPMPEGEEDEHPMAPHREPAAPLREQVSLIKPNPVPTPKPVPRVTPWEIPAIQCYEPPDGVFYAQMGPTGGKQGYPAITGHVGWGISWYINGLLIPEINVVRGKKYTFVVEGGSNPEVPARYHPFYITNDPVGGYHHKTEQEKKGVEIYAGVRRARNGELQPTGLGRLCNWTPDNEGPEADEYRSFGAYQRSLTLVCDEGNPGVVTWTPDRNTPDTVYYQCFTHRHLGWKINVVDECDAVEGEESRVMERVVPPADLRAADSLQVLARAPPDNSLDHRAPTITNTKTNYDNFSSATGLMGEVYNDEPSQKDREIELVTNSQIKDVIQAVETMETKLKDDIKNKKPVQKPLGQYQVHEDVKEMFLPEQPVREDDEYTVETGKKPETYFLPANNKPLTLQSVLKPNGPKPAGNMRPPFRRPAPPEIKLRRPPPMFQKANNQGYPLPLPNPHGPHPMQKKQQKFNNGRMPPNMNRPMMHMIGPPPMKQTPALHNKPPGFNQQSGFNQKPGFNQQPGLNQQPDFKQQPGFNQHSDVKQQHEFNQKPGFNQQLGLNQQPDFKLQPGFNQQPDVKQQHEFNQKPGFNQQPGLNQQPDFKLQPGFNQQPDVKQQHEFNQKPGFNQPHQKLPPKLVGNSVQSIIMGKPMGSNILSGNPVKSQTLNLGFADIIANQVVKSQITLPGSIDVITQHSSPPHVKHGQIILGKPMDNPVPLDQQMIHNNPFSMRQPPTPPPHIKTSTFRIKLNNEQSVHKEHRPHQDHPAQNEIVSSDFLGESTDSSTLTPAVNTGFKPDSIVVESGFKPIIREPLMAGEDKIANYNDREGSVNRREDTDVEESDYEDSEQIITNHAYPSEHMTQSFEPMFIPSPEDHVIQTNHRTKEVFPSNHAKEDRPHPVYLKTETKINALFSKKNMEKDVPDMLMESDRVSPHYLPPDPKLPKEHSQKLSNQQTFTTYDGKTVSAATLTSVPDVNKTSTKIFSSKLPASSELLLKMPQFGPFKGEIPPPVAAHIATDSKLPSVSLNKTTKLKPVRSDSDLDDDDDDLGAAASEMLDLTDELEDEEEEEESKKRSRSKRESRSTQFERGEVEPVRTNGHSITRLADPSAARSLSRTPHIVLLAILLNLF